MLDLNSGSPGSALSKLPLEGVHCSIENLGFVSATGAEAREKTVLRPPGFLN